MTTRAELRAWAEDQRRQRILSAEHSRQYAAWLRTAAADAVPAEQKFGGPEESEADAEAYERDAAMYAAVLALLAQPEGEREADGLPELVVKIARRRNRLREKGDEAVFEEKYRYHSMAGELDIVLDELAALGAAPAVQPTQDAEPASTLCCSVGPHTHSVYGVAVAPRPEGEAREDAARLDWLEEASGRFGGVGISGDARSIELTAGDDEHTAPTLRAAIDAARAVQPAAADPEVGDGE